MRLKKLKRLLSLALSTAMVASMLSVPVRAESMADLSVPAQEETADGHEDGSKAHETDETEGSQASDAEGLGGPEEPEGTTPEEDAEDGEAAAPVENTLAKAADTGDAATENNAGEETDTPPQAQAPIIAGGTGADAKTLDQAIKEATPGDVIELAGDVTITEDHNLGTGDNAVQINTNGHMIRIEAGTAVSLTGGVFQNELLAAKRSGPYSASEARLMFYVGGRLEIHGGEYHTKGTSILSIQGEAMIDGASFTSDVKETEIADLNYYDGTALINVSAAEAKLTMTSGTVSAETGNLTGTKDYGMYGVYVNSGGEVTLGTTDADGNHSGPTINSMFAAVGMNYTASPGRVTIEGGTYTSSASCTKENEKKFNAVLYLPATASVAINGGTFTSQSTGANTTGNVISIPYVTPAGHTAPVRLNLTINGGSFTHAGAGSVFYGEGVTSEATKVKVKVNGGTFSGTIPEKYLDAEHGFYQKADGSYEVLTAGVSMVGSEPYTSLEGAVAAAKEGTTKTVQLQKDIILENDLDLSSDKGDISILTNGHTITVPANKTVTIKAGTASKIENSQAVSATVPATGSPGWGAMTPAERKTILSVEEDGNLTLENGTYESKGVYLLYTAGEVTVKGANLKCIAPDNLATLRYYDGASVVVAKGDKAKLTMPSGSIQSEVSNAAKDCGMYGVYLKKGAEVTLGTTDGGPTIETVFAAVSMNGLEAPGTITIQGGAYKNSVSCATADEKFNAVLYLPASANVTINGGTFTATGSGSSIGKRHVIAVPYNNISNGGKSKVDLTITGGSFNVTNPTSGSDAIFYDAGMTGTDSKNRILIKAGTFNLDPGAYAGCRKKTSNNDGTVTITDEITGDSHTFTWAPKQENTCWEEGVIGHYECLTCHEMAANKDGTEPLSAKDVTIPKKEHAGVTGIVVEPKAPTCTTPGTTGYTQCPNCLKCYKNQEALDADKTGTGLPETDPSWVIPALNHEYSKASFAWGSFLTPDDFKGDQFQPGEANGVTVTRTCTRTGCKDEEEGHTQHASVSVHVASAPEAGDGSADGTTRAEAEASYPWTGKTCSDTYDITFTATATFAGSVAPTTVTDSHKITIPGKQHTYTGQVTFNWDKFDALHFTPNAANGVTASGNCAVCGDPGTPTVTVTCLGNYNPDTFTCSEKLQFKAIATFGLGEDAPTIDDTQTFPGEHKLEKRASYQAPTCTADGQWAYYECTACHNYYFGEDSALKDDYIGKNESDPDKHLEPDEVTPEVLAKLTKIDKIAHSFVKDKCEWKTGTDDAIATFRCVNCKNKVAIENAAGATEEQKNVIIGPPTGGEDISCGLTVQKTYPVTVKFDKLAVKTDVAPNGTVTLTYVKSEETKGTTEYPFSLTRTQTQSHSFGKDNVRVEWADTYQPSSTADTDTPDDGSSNKTYHNTSLGVVVVMTCSGCKKTVKFHSKDGNYTFEKDMNEDLLISPVRIVGTDTKLATCREDGKVSDYYKIRYDNFDGSGWRYVNFGEALDDLPHLTSDVKSNPDNHNWSNVAWGNFSQKMEGQEGDQTPKTIPVTVDGKTYQVPCYTVTGTRTCQNNGCTAEQKATGEAGTTNTPGAGGSAAPYVNITVGHREKTCTVSGRTTYDATFYAPDGTAAKDPSPQHVYNEPATGHKFNVTWEWNADNPDPDKASKYTSVNVTRKCAVETCQTSTPRSYRVSFDETNLKETDANGNKIYVSKKVGSEDFDTPSEDPEATNGTGLKVVVSGKEPSCTEGGEVKYHATVIFNSETILEGEKEIKRDKMGHEIAWVLHWTKDDTAKDEKDRYSLTAKKECVKGDLPAEGEANIKSIGLTYTHTPGTCTTKGTDVWAPSENDENWKSIKDEASKVEANKLKQTTDLGLDLDNHPISNPTIQWNVSQSTEPATKGQTIVTAHLTGACDNANSNCPDPAQTLDIPATLKAGMIQQDDSCVQDTNLTYEFSTAGLKGWVIEDSARTNTLTIKRTGHFLERVEGEGGTCTTAGVPTHYHCTKCTKNYKSADALVPIEITGAPLGHQYGFLDDYVTFDWTHEGTAAEARFECTRRGCAEDTEGHFKTLTATIGTNPYISKEAECETTKENGISYYAVSVKIESIGSTEDGENIYPEGFSGPGIAEGELKRIVPYGAHKFEGANGKCKWCNATKATDIQVTFYGRNQNVLSTRSYKNTEESLTIEVPNPPSVLGMSFDGWKLGTEVYAQDEIAAAVASAVKASKGDPVEVTATYRTASQKAQVRIVKKFDGTPEATVPDFEEADAGDYKSKPVDGSLTVGETTYRFSHWEIGEGENATTVGTGLECTIRLQEGDQVTLYACYTSDTSSNVEPTVTMTAVRAVVEADVPKLLFTSNAVLPTGYELVENGMLYTVSPESTTADSALVWIANATGAIKKQVFDTSVNNTMTMKIGSANTTKLVRVRAYLRYRDTATGEIKVAYGDIVKTTYNDAAAQQAR